MKRLVLLTSVCAVLASAFGAAPEPDVNGLVTIPFGSDLGADLRIGLHNAYVIELPSGTYSSGQTVELFKTTGVSYELEGDDLASSVFLTGPVVGYALAFTGGAVTATITDVSNQGATRKATVFTAGTGDGDHWNNEDQNWSNGAPGQDSFDIGLFLRDSRIGYHGEVADWGRRYGTMVMRSATVDTHTTWHPKLRVLEIVGFGTIKMNSIDLVAREGLPMSVADGIALEFHYNGWGDRPAVDGGSQGVRIDGTLDAHDVVIAKGEPGRMDGTLTVGNVVACNGTLCVGDGFVIGDGATLTVGTVEISGGRHAVSDWKFRRAEEIVLKGGVVEFPAVASDITYFPLPEGVSAAPESVSDVTVQVAGSSSAWELAVVGDEVVVRLLDGKTNEWIGAGEDNHWQTSENWLLGVPTEDQTVSFGQNAEVVLTAGVNVSNIVVKAGVRAVLRSSDIWYVSPSIHLWGVSGGGTLAMGRIGFKSLRKDGAPLEIAVKTLEIINNCAGWSDDLAQARDSWIEGTDSVRTIIRSNLAGTGGYLIGRNALTFTGDNTEYRGAVKLDSVGAEGRSDRHFETAASLFANATSFVSRGKIFLDFTEGTTKLGTIDFGESWGATFELKEGADVALEVAGGKIIDTYFGDGFEVNGGGNLTIRKVGPGTLVYGVVKAHALEIAEGRVEFTGEGDDSAVSVIVRAGASIGNAPAQTSGNGTQTGGAAVTVNHKFTFDDGAIVAQTLAEAGEGGLSVPVLTVAPTFDVTNVRFGFTNPELLPPVVRGVSYAKYTVADSPALTGTARTVDDGIVPEGSARNCRWKASAAGNAVVFRAFRPGLVVFIK